MSVRLPLLVVLGATGTGKSKLAIELAQKFVGEIISADSMQVYRGLDVISNKVTQEERATVPHYLLDILDPHQEYTVQDFRNQALTIIDDIQKRGHMPVVVGGTNYYIESLIWKILVDNPAEDKKRKLDESHSKIAEEMAELSNEDLHKRLKEVDPMMASTLHPNNRRKVLRSLEVAAKTGKKHSELLEQQHSQPGGDDVGGPLRFPDAILIWLQCEQTVLDERLDKRVDAMMEAGLMKEMIDFHEKYNQQRLGNDREPDYTRGIFQSIGFKEFHDYLIMNKNERDSIEGEKLLQKGIEEMKLVTRRYARRQVKWIRNRFLRRPGRHVPPLFAVDGTDLNHWNLLVRDAAYSIVDARLSGSPSPLDPLPNETPLPNDHESFTCHTCNRLFIGSLQWKAHQKSAKHYRQLKKINKPHPIDESCP